MALRPAPARLPAAALALQPPVEVVNSRQPQCWKTKVHRVAKEQVLPGATTILENERQVAQFTWAKTRFPRFQLDGCLCVHISVARATAVIIALEPLEQNGTGYSVYPTVKLLECSLGVGRSWSCVHCVPFFHRLPSRNFDEFRVHLFMNMLLMSLSLCLGCSHLAD